MFEPPLDDFDLDVWHGVQTLLDHYVALQPGDTVLILYASDSCRPAAWVSAALEIRGNTYRRVWMAPLVDPRFAARLKTALPEPNTERLVVLSFERDTISHGMDLREALAPYSGARVWRAISASADLFRSAMHATPQQLSARNTAVLEALRPARTLHITTAGGTDLRVTLDPAHRWISNRGTGRATTVKILPAGEVATFPATIDGIFVADFAFNVNAITDVDARLQSRPVKVTIADGRAVDVQCDDERVAGFVGDCFARRNARQVGELGFGTNPAIGPPIPMNSHINERRPGLHLGFGQHNQDLSVVAYHSSIHLDLIARGAVITSDTGSPPLDLENLPPPTGQHPLDPLDQDVSSFCETDLEIDDCCGILDSDGLRPFDRSLTLT